MLWALDTEAREAVLRGEDGWVLLSLDRGWQPVALGGPDAALRWSLFQHVVPAGVEYPTLHEALIEVRRVCASALEMGKPSAAKVQELLQSGGLLREERNFIEVIRRFAGPLDRFFMGRGSSEGEAFDRSMQVLLKLRQQKKWVGLGHRKLALLLFELAREVDEVVISEAPENRSGSPGASGSLLEPDFLQERRWLRKELDGLSWEELACLTLWAEGHYGIPEISSLLGLSSEIAEERLADAAKRLRRSPEQLRSRWLAQICEQALLSRTAPA